MMKLIVICWNYTYFVNVLTIDGHAIHGYYNLSEDSSTMTTKTGIFPWSAISTVIKLT